MDAGDRFLQEIRRKQAEAGAEAGGPRYRRVTSEVCVSDELRKKLFGDAYPEAVEVTLQGLSPERVVYFDDLGRDVTMSAPVKYRVARVEGGLMLIGAVPGTRWEESLAIPLKDG